MIPWIKVEMTTPDKIEVLSMARLLKIRDWDAVVGKLIRLWVLWADLHTVDGNHVQRTERFIEKMAARQ